MTSKPEDFGELHVAGFRVFNRTPLIREVALRPVGKHWECPMDECDGEMIFNGKSWPGKPAPGFDHTCNKCGFSAAVTARFPFVDYEEI